MAEEAAHLMLVEKQKKERKGPASQNPLQGHSPNDLNSSHLLKVPPPPN
jgi:hypothetical protein